MTSIPSHVTVFEVGPRDGLQNESTQVNTETKISLVNKLSQTGLSRIEAGSFVSPKWVPQMSTSSDVFDGIRRQPGVCYTALTPNLKGLEAALTAGVDEVAVFAAASQGFSQKNINCSIEESIERFIPLLEKARAHNLPVRGYVSCVIACPYDGEIAPTKVADVVSRLDQLGCYQISLGDTIGIGTPGQMTEMINVVSEQIEMDKLALHCHDTYGQALANIYAALQLGISTFDSSVAGLGGCPYAKGASGNVATEDVLFLMQGLEIETGVDLSAVIDAGQYISQKLNRPNQSKVAQALAGK